MNEVRRLFSPWVHNRLAAFGPRPSGRATLKARLGAASGCGLRGEPCHGSSLRSLELRMRPIANVANILQLVKK